MGPGVDIEFPACPLCGETAGQVVARAPDIARGLQQPVWEVLACAGCSLARLSPRPTAGALAAHYYEGYAPHSGAAPRRARGRWERWAMEAHWGIPPRSPRGALAGAALRAITAPLAWKLARRGRGYYRLRWQGQGRLLDVGCGRGDWLAAMRDWGWRPLGVELDPGAARGARERHGLDVRAGTLEDLDLSAASLDVVTFWHSLEHLGDPLAALRRARALLDAGGRVVIAVPNFAAASRRWAGAHWSNLDLPRHLFHFSPDSLERLVRAAGLEPCALGFERTHHDLLRSIALARRDGLEAGWMRWGAPLLRELYARRSAWAGVGDNFWLTASAAGCEARGHRQEPGFDPQRG